jgi:anti-sigma factor RsiW
MKELSDEELNKYIDGELSRDEIKEVEDIISNSRETLKRLRALREADQSLRSLKVSETSLNFTSLVMKRIERSLRSRKEQKKFIIAIASVFLILCSGVLGIVIFEMIKNFNPGTSSTVQVSVKYLVSVSDFVTSILSSKNISLVGAIFSFGLIISAWFFFDYSKILRKVEK